MRTIAAVALVCALCDPVAAEDTLYDRLWPEVPERAQLTLSQQITDELTSLGNTLGHHLDALSGDLVGVRFDGRRRRASVRVGTSRAERYLTLELAGDVHFTQGVARVHATLDVGVAGHVLSLELPDFEMAPTSYRDERGVEIRLPLLRGSF